MWCKALASMHTPSATPSGRNLADFDAHQSAPGVPAPTDAELAEGWFDAPPPSTRRPSAPPPPVSALGEFIGDEIADAWLR